jgi:hypothetical protein
MVKVGFICEGATEKIIVESEMFQKILTSFQLQLIKVINAEGKDNLLPKFLPEFRQSLTDDGCQKIIILTDLESDPCITETKNRIGDFADQFIIVAVKAIEAWYLADSVLLSSLFKKNYSYPNPETREELPFEILKREFITHTERGCGSDKPLLAKRMLRNGFDLQNASQHINCMSAKYFLDKLKEISKS